VSSSPADDGASASPVIAEIDSSGNGTLFGSSPEALEALRPQLKSLMDSPLALGDTW